MKRARLPILVVLLLLAAWLYLPPFAFTFIGDDFMQQWRIRMFLDAPLQVVRVLRPGWTDWYYRPLQHAWFLANRLAFGLNPFGYYLLQAWWHTLAVALLYRLARGLRLPAWAALLAAALFAFNGQHQLTVNWISSIAIVMGGVFSLLAAVLWLAYLRRGDGRWLPGVLLSYLLALLAHETGFLAALFLAGAALGKRPLPRRAWLFLGVLLALLGGYVGMQLLRETAYVSVGAAPLLAALRPDAFGQFGWAVLTRWLGWPGQPLPGGAAVVGVGLLGLAAAGAWYGRRPLRLGLLWLGLHLGFIYFGLWAQRADVFGNRHLYAAWIGASLALAALAAQLAQARAGRPWGRRLAVVWSLLLCLLIGGQLWTLGAARRSSILPSAAQLPRLAADARALVPAVTPQTRVYAARFGLTTQYFVPALSVWLDAPQLRGGSLDDLWQEDELTDDVYVLDEADGRLVNLMPELQEAAHTRLLWRQAAGSDLIPGAIVGPADAPRLALRVQPEGEAWTTRTFSETIPAGSSLAVGWLGGPGAEARIRIGGDVVWEAAPAAAGGWQAARLPLDAYAGRRLAIHLETRGAGGAPVYWANPRLVWE